ncbi:hypothetical protein [Massilia horti]|uniref:hypothetical protein n=1 Tax=Massilia horti TaxID=2562153 RepID=UPI00143116C4|nr:hypothetical protein [Massilia horti]
MKSKQNTIAAIIGVIAAGYFGWFYIGGGLEKQAAIDMRKIENQVADDSVKQYRIAKESGTMMDRCVHAGMVSAAFIQAQDQGNYAKWKQIESEDCKAAGLER